MPNITANPAASLDALRARPGVLVSPADLRGAGIVSSYTTLDRWVRKGVLPPPHRLPTGGLRWRAGDVLRALGLDGDALRAA